MNKRWSILGLALGALVLGVMVGLITVGSVAADPTPGVRIQIPRLDVGDVLGTGDWETWIQAQNVSHDVDTGAIFFGWGEYSELCPSNAPGPIVHYCQLIRGNALWTLRTQLPDYVVRDGITHTIQSGIIYSVRADAFQKACDAAGWAEGNTHRWLEWEKEWENGDGQILNPVTGLPDYPFSNFGGPPGTGAQGEDLAVTVTRYGPNDYGTFVSSTYTGISEQMEGDHEYPYEYYAPYVMKGYNGLDTELTIQNSGQMCTSVWIHYQEQGTCKKLYDHHIEQLAPGEAIRLKVPCNVGQIPCFWLGSAHISAEQPLGIIVDETSFDEPCGSVDRGTLLTHRARPKEEYRDGELLQDYKVYADLIFREWSGWDASIQVQNLSETSQPTFVTVDFLDNSGDEILFLADWVCPTGSTTFYLPIVTDLLPGYVGAAEIQSHSQVSFPGTVTDAQPIFAVVDLKKPDDPYTPDMDAQGGSYNAHPESQKEWVSEIALPFMGKDAINMWTSFIAIRNNSNCNKIKGRIHFKDETGRGLCELQVPWLHPKHVKLIDLNNVGCLTSGYVGSARFQVGAWNAAGKWDFALGIEQLCDTDQDGAVDQQPVMPSVIVVEKGILGATLNDVIAYGDVTNIYEGIPYATNIPPCYGDIFGTVTVRQENHGFDRPEINDAVVSVWDFDPTNGLDVLGYDITDSTGGYQITHVENGTHFMSVTKTDFFTGTTLTTVECGEETLQDFELICSNPLTVTVTATGEDGAPHAVPGATVTAAATYEYNADTMETYTTTGKTNNAGVARFDVAGAAEIEVTASADGHDDATVTVPFADNDDCYAKPEAEVRLCKHNTIVGTIKIGGQWAVGYKLKAINMSDPDLPEVDSDVTTALGVFSLEGFSLADGPNYRIQLFNSSGGYVSSKDFTLPANTCGATGVLTYTNGIWTGPTW